MKVYIRETIPIDSYRAIERRETFHAISYFISGNLIYFRKDRFNIRTVSKNEVVKIEYLPTVCA